MSGIQLADPAGRILYRIGRPADPLARPEPEYRGAGRFDDPANEFGVLYVAEARRTCYLETLDTFRPDQALLQRLLLLGSESFIPQSGVIPDSYFSRRIGQMRPDVGQRWLDLRVRTPESPVALSQEPTIASLLPELGYGKRLKPGDLLGSDRRLTQAVARWAFDNGFAGLAYSCSHDVRLDCWAVFEGATWTIAGPPLPIESDDADLIAVAKAFRLTISFADPA